jgi:hypothetical protein
MHRLTMPHQGVLSTKPCRPAARKPCGLPIASSLHDKTETPSETLGVGVVLPPLLQRRRRDKIEPTPASQHARFSRDGVDAEGEGTRSRKAWVGLVVENNI